MPKGGIFLDWERFYERFYDWEESTQISRISSLTSFGPPDEVVEIAEAYFEEKDSSRFLQKAISYGVVFSAEQIIDLINYCDQTTADLLLKTAKCTFSPEQLEELWDIVDNTALVGIANRQGLQYDEEYGEFWRASPSRETHLTKATPPPGSPPPTPPIYRKTEPQQNEEGCLSILGKLLYGLLILALGIATGGIILLAYVIILLVRGKSSKGPKPHYGYRYGRWYYGTGHRYGCQSPEEDPHCRK